MSTQNGGRGNCTKYTADPVGIMGRKSCLYTILEYSVLARFSAHTLLDQLYAFASIPSSSILRAHLCQTLWFTLSSEQKWSELAPLPERICYAALVVDEQRGGIWLLGGKDCNLKVWRQVADAFDPYLCTSDIWSTFKKC